MVAENPKVTVLLSVYNDQKFIGQAVESILGQSYRDFELLIIDDCSTDDTVEVINKYDDPRIRLIVNEENIDISKSLNKGLKLARGQYIARQDSDDISISDRLLKQVKFLDDNPDIVAVGSRTEFIDAGGNHAGYWNQEVSSEEIFYALSYRCCLTSSSMVYRRKPIVQLGGYDESSSHAEDYELFYRISRKYKIYVIPYYLIRYRVRQDQRLSKNYVPISERTFEIASRTGIDSGLLKFLLDRDDEKPLAERLKLINRLHRFHAGLIQEADKLGLSRLKMKSVCAKMMMIFIVKASIGKKGKKILKRA